MEAGKELGERIRSLRKVRNIGLKQLAKTLRVDHAYLSRIESGRVAPSEKILIKIARILKADREELGTLAGNLPTDVKRIFRDHSAAALGLLRESFGHPPRAYDEADTALLALGEPKTHYGGRLDLYDLVQGDCFEWFDHQEPDCIQAIVTDPPYGLKEYSGEETAKLRAGRGGVWRIPPTFDGCTRRPLPRFTVLTVEEKLELRSFFERWATKALRVLVPGAHVFIATNPLLSHLVYVAMIEAGFEKRGEIIRTVQTLRGGDRPKNAHKEFDEVTVMPRSCWEPWGLFRKPCEGRVQDNLRKWKTGGLRRISGDQPFCDLVRSAPTRSIERDIAPHPSLKPQAFMRQIVRAALPLGEGIVLDPFMGGGSTIAAACAVGYRSIGIERDPEFFTMADRAIPRLAVLVPNGESGDGMGRGFVNGEISQANLFG